MENGPSYENYTKILPVLFFWVFFVVVEFDTII